MEDFWFIISTLLAQVALVLLLDGKIEGAFVVGVLGVLAWFLSLRSQIARANSERDSASKVEREDGFGEEDED